MTAFLWTPDHLASLASEPPAAAPSITPGAVRRVTNDLDLWDHWPLLEADGTRARIDGREWVFGLTAPVFDDPERRHGFARLRLFSVAGDDWNDLGPVFEEGFTPGSREWAGSAVIDAKHQRLELYFTAAGDSGEPALTFRQRIVRSSAGLARIDDVMRPVDWSPAEDLIHPDDINYQSRHEGGAKVGAIKAFRDPFVFIDPENGQEHMLFTGSSPATNSPWNGVIGLANRTADSWTIQPPLVSAMGVNNELERPHIVRHQGLIYLFWSTQAGVFASGIEAPTGLYGLVADRLEGPWSPLNRSGLVFANPGHAPAQAYSWQVLDDLEVWSFADQIALPGRATQPAPFAGAPAPRLNIWLKGDCAGLEA